MNIHNRQRPCILVIDDVDEIVEELVTMLNLLDMPATGASSLGTAMALLEREASIRIVACDIRLEGESGADIVKHVAASPALAGRGLDFLFMTGDSMRFDASTRIAGCPVLMKPVQPAELVRVIEERLGRGSAQP